MYMYCIHVCFMFYMFICHVPTGRSLVHLICEGDESPSCPMVLCISDIDHTNQVMITSLSLHHYHYIIIIIIIIIIRALLPLHYYHHISLYMYMYMYMYVSLHTVRVVSTVVGQDIQLSVYNYVSCIITAY